MTDREAEVKFNNFKQLIAAQNINSPIVSIFMNVPFSTFCEKFGEQVKQGITKKQAVEKALAQISATKKDFREEDYKKFTRYIDYFIGYCKVMNS